MENSALNTQWDIPFGFAAARSADGILPIQEHEYDSLLPTQRAKEENLSSSKAKAASCLVRS
jgi:hypothetical protein